MGFPAPTHDSIKAKTARIAAPGFSYCLRCGMPWRLAEGHVTNYGGGRGCFPLCEGCWTLLGHPEARVEYYGAMVDEWELQAGRALPDERTAIGRAVANERTA